MKKENEVLINFYLPESLKVSLDVICARERTTKKDLLVGLVSDYVKVHGDGNNQYKITQFDNDKMMACPALFRPIRFWKWWLKSVPKAEVMRVQQQIIAIDKQVLQVI